MVFYSLSKTMWYIATYEDGKQFIVEHEGREAAVDSLPGSEEDILKLSEATEGLKLLIEEMGAEKIDAEVIRGG